MNDLQVLKNETIACSQGMTSTERPSTQILVHNMSSQGKYHASGTPHPSPVSTKNTPASGRARWNPLMTQHHLQQQPAVQDHSSGTPKLQPPPPRPSLSKYNSMTEASYRGAHPTIPNFASRDPNQALHLITPVEPVQLGPPGGPAAIRTRIEKVMTCSRQDNEAISILETKATGVEVDSVYRYATPLLWGKDMPCFQAPKEAVMPSLRSVEWRLSKEPEQAKASKAEMDKLIWAGSVIKLKPQRLTDEEEVWYVPHHMVSHNGKNRLVFSCSYQYRGQSLYDHLLPGSTLGASLLEVLLRFREHAVAISGDIKGMFHQVHLLAEDRFLLRFVWRDMS
ncbi:hypothetical protein AOLI_G00018440 [Acnodon oligacanthus]